VDLLGETRALIVQHLRDTGDASVAELAAHLGISDVATRRHVDKLAEDVLLDSTTVNPGRGRPVARWSLTERALELFPSRYDEIAHELLDFLTANSREELGAFLRWRQDRQVASYADEVDAADVHSRLKQLAGALSRDGYRAEVDTDADGFTLRQQHCTIAKVAADQPLLCAHEAAAFGRLLGDDVRVTRRETIAKGDGACVCHVQVREPVRNALPVVPVSSPTTSCTTRSTSTSHTTPPTTEEDPL
jgi:predicted ArsR family transcriptional regulator